MENFVAIDVETANGKPTSICAVGAVKVLNGAISDTFYRLVRPVPNYYYSYFTDEIHGIGRKDTDSQPTFNEILRRTFPRQLCPSFSLPFLADFLGIPFNNHHNALADAEACAKIAMTIL